MEVWKDIIGYEGKYQVSNYGRVKSLERIVWNRFQFVPKKERILKKRYNRKGYITVILYSNNKPRSFAVHRLVALHFLANPESKKQVNHINGCKVDNRVSNLEWVTGSENQSHAFKLGLYDKKLKMQSENLSKPVLMMSIVGEELFVFPSITLANHYFNQKYSHISDVCSGKRKFALGYRWKYISKEEYKSLHTKYVDQQFQIRDLSITPIDVYDMNHQFICTYPTIEEAARKLSISRHSIMNCCMKNGNTHGYFFRYHDLSKKQWYEKWKMGVNK